MELTKINLFTILLFLISSILFGQPNDNLTRIHKLIDKSINTIPNIDDDFYTYFEIAAPDNYKNLINRVELYLTNFGLSNLLDQKLDSTNVLLKYRIDFAGVDYKDLQRDGLFGSYFLEREVSLKGYFISQKGKTTEKSGEFSLSEVDTIPYKDVLSYENPSILFTQSEIPTEPFWSGIAEPVIAIGAVIITLLLFFTVRSK